MQSIMICLHIFMTALLGSVPFRAANSCQHIIQSGDSTGSGEYWVDPQGNGNSFKAFCDMTTDGGTLVFFVFQLLILFSRLFLKKIFFLIQRRLDDGVKHYFSKLSIVMVECHR